MAHQRALALVIGMTLCSACGSTTQDGEDASVHDDGDLQEDGAAEAGTPSETTHRPPPRPDLGADGDVGRVVFALRNVVLDQTGDDAWRHVGYDLDGYDTVSAASAVTHGHECVPPAEHAREPADGWSVEHPPDVPLDGEDGIDNVFAPHLYPHIDPWLETLAPDIFAEASLQDVARAYQDEGHGTWLLVLDGWNGGPEDRMVAATLVHAAAGTPCAQLDDVTFNEAHEPVLASDTTTPAPPPAWNGNDCWWVRDDDFIAGTSSSAPVLHDDLAYVSGGTLVMHLAPRAPLRFFLGPLAMVLRLTGSVLTAHLTGGNGGAPFALEEAIVAGRWSANDWTEDAEHLGYCPHGILHLIPPPNPLSGLLDVRSNPNDPHSLDQPCNALSLGLRFESGTPGTLAGDTLADAIAPTRPLPEPCAEEPEE
jgi:hypothetical protein